MATPIPLNHAGFSLDEVLSATGGRVIQAAGVSASSVTTDSRAIVEGTLFIPLKGERFDGHAFLADAGTRGAAMVLVEKGSGAKLPAGVTTVEVDDTLHALGDLARAYRRRWGRTVVAITGSAGKTGTKELTAAALSADGSRVLKTSGNLNNRIGVPMTLFQLSDAYDVAVVEMGTSEPGEIARLAEIGEPNVGVVTLVAPAHVEGLGTIQRVAEEKGALLMALPPNGTAIANGDVSVLRPWLEQSPAGTRLTFGMGDLADVRLLSFEIDEELHTKGAWILSRDGRAVAGKLGLLGEGAARNAAAALAVAVALGRDPDRAMHGMEAVHPGDGRMHAVPTTRPMLLIDDTYNANPRSMDLAIETVALLAKKRGTRAVAFLGAMKELGNQSRDHHLLVGERVVSESLAAFVGCGDEMAAAVEYARASGVPDARWVANSADAARIAQDLVRDGDVVIVKGSRSMTMERVVDALRNGARNP